ncbi:hypothetical protein [Agrobacterium vitis]|uniref:hypothetical protein n=1 Tax=Agrobacterium vitis TaxID=373 RepID=UPI0012E95BF0|nr:hypothetical protein [Agrobacterium vitis]MVA61728.1 hypothetical protein [Agrobacterium vitis]
MRDIDSATLAALERVPIDSFAPRTLAWFTAKERSTGHTVGRGFWSGDEDLNLTVFSGLDGSLVSRSYIAAGNLLKVSDIPQTSDFTVQTITIDISQIADAARQLVREYDLRLGKVEIHELLIDPKTGEQIAPGSIIFMGEIDGAPIKTPRTGGTGSASIKAVSDVMSMLTRSNPVKSSYEGQKARSNDQWGKDTAVIATWKIAWGQKST